MLDVVTVLTYNVVINFALMIVATVAWARNPRQKEIVFWALSAWFMIIGTLASSLTEHVPYNILGYLGGLIYVGRSGLMRLGFKEFYGQPYRLRQGLQVSFLVAAGMALAKFANDPTAVRVSLIYLGSAVNLALAARDLWQGRPGERLPSGRLAAIVYAAYALSSLLIATLPILYPIQFVGRTPVSEWLTYTSMLLLVFNLLAFLMAMVLTLERGGEIQRQLAERDSLTGLVNRRMFLREAGRLAEAGNAAVAVLDLDHFKRINDTYGHKGGDDALIQFAQHVTKALPEGAIFGRLGGEEFGICLPRHDRISALNVMEAALASLLSRDIRSGDHRFRLSFSCGLTIMNDPARSLDAWMADADAGLYLAKDGGRSRVVAHQPERPAPRATTDEATSNTLPRLTA
jgi:diguanylate cyclase (GGDEF)-like protein